MTERPSPPSQQAMTAMVDALVEQQRQEAQAFLSSARLLADLESAADAADPAFGWPVWAAEAGLALGLSEGSVRARAARAQRLLEMPALCSALEVGQVGVAHALAVLDVLSPAGDSAAAHACASVLPLEDDDRPSPARLAERVRRAWYAADAEAVARTRQEGLHSRRFWARHLIAPGVSSLGATGAAEEVLAASERLAVAARRPVDADDLRTVAQREADLVLALLVHGRLPEHPLPTAAVQLALHVPVETARGESDEPGLLVGAGWLDAEHCRELARTAELVAVAVDPVTRMPVARADARGGPVPRPPSPRSAEQLADAVALVGEAAATAVVRPEAERLDVEHPGYRPPPRLQRLVRTRFPGCVAPTSTSTRTDLDHVVAWPAGPTAATNLLPLSRRWHRLKQAGFVHFPATDGSVVWVSPAARTYRTPPPWRPPRRKAPSPTLPPGPDASTPSGRPPPAAAPDPPPF